MSNWDGPSNQVMALPKPGRALTGVMLALFALWLMFAAAMNWGGAGPGLFELLVGNTNAILGGQVWRLFTAPLLHSPNDPWHVMSVLLGLYFLTPSLEERWGARRLLGFFALSALVAYGCQLLAELLLPASIAGKLSLGYWYGAAPIVEAVAVAWALQFRGQTVRLMFVLPVTTKALLGFVVGFSVLRLIAAQQTPEGLIAPFGGMLAGWLFGSGTPSPARRLYLKLRYSKLQRESARARRQRAERAKNAPFSVIKGGQGRRDDDDGPGGKYLN